MVSEGHVQVLSCNYLDLDDQNVKAAHNLGLEVHAWTVNEERAMRRVLGLQVDSIISDYPDHLYKLPDQPCNC